MACASTAAAADGLRTIQHAREAGYLLQSIWQTPELARVQRVHGCELEQTLSPCERRKLDRTQPAACSYCGAMVIPGWTGNMRLSNVKLARRKRKPHDRLRRNRLDWTCASCGRTLQQAGSDPLTKSRFRPVKKQASLPVLLEGPVVSSSSRPRAREDLSPAVQELTAPRLHTTRPSSDGATTFAKQDALLGAQPPATASSARPVLAPKKKRTKREGLQAMLQAKREQEEQAKQATGSLGLTSFLKGLQ